MFRLFLLVLLVQGPGALCTRWFLTAPFAYNNSFK